MTDPQLDADLDNLQQAIECERRTSLIAHDIDEAYEPSIEGYVSDRVFWIAALTIFAGLLAAVVAAV